MDVTVGELQFHVFLEIGRGRGRTRRSGSRWRLRQRRTLRKINRCRSQQQKHNQRVSNTEMQ